MARAEAGTAKYYSKQLKASGLQKLRFYCQICQKQCRDANGFKNHLNSPSHKGRVENLSESGQGYLVVERYSKTFTDDFMRLLRINHGTKKINANKFYQEYILNDKDHVHMNSTKWSSLTSFVKYLGNKGLVRVLQSTTDTESEFNLEIQYIDDSSDYYLKKRNFERKSKMEKSDNDLSMKRITEQIERGKDLEELQKAERKGKQEPVPVTSNGPIKLVLKPKANKISKKNAFNDESSEEE